MAAAARKFGIAVLGLGRMGTIHTKTLMLSPKASVKWIMRNDLEAAEKFANTFDSHPKCATPSQYDQILNDPSVDAVVICSLTTAHEAQIMAALEAGKGVFSEKPVTPEVKSTKACYELAEKTGKPLLCAFHRRFDPSFVAVKTSLTSKLAGNLRLVRCSSHDPSAPPIHYIKNSGGILNDSTIHDLDMALWLTGSPAKRVFVQGRAFDPDIGACGDFDMVVVTIEHANGTLSVIDNGRRCAHGYDQRLEAICDEGSYVVTNRPSSLLYTHTTAASTTPAIDQMFDTRYTEAYAAEIQHFLDVLSGGTDPRVTKTDTLSVMLLAAAATESARSGKPVDLSQFKV